MALPNRSTPMYTGPAPTVQPYQAPRASTLQSINAFLDSPLGKQAIAALGAYAKSKGEEKQQEADRQLRRDQFEQDARLRTAQLLQERAGVGANRPIGESQNFAQQQLLRAALASALFQGQQAFRPNNPAIAGQMGFRPLQLDPRLMQQLTDPEAVKAATAQSIQMREADLLGQNPHLAQTNLGALGLAPQVPQGPGAALLSVNPQLSATGAEDPRKAAVERGMRLWQQQNDLMAESLAAQNQADMVRATGKPIDPKTGLPKGYTLDKNGNLKKKGFWDSGWGKALKIGALGAATIATGGVASPALAAAIGAGAGALQGATSGGGVKGALLGAGLGAATGGIGNAAAGAGMAAAAKAAMRDPKFYAQMLGAMR